MRRNRVLVAASFSAFVLGLAATLMVFAQDRILDADSFSTTLTATLDDPAVNDYLADAIGDALIEQAPDLAISGPLLSEVIGSVLASDVAGRVIESAAFEAHRAVFDGGDDNLVLELSDLVVSIDNALRAISPDLADAIPERVTDLSVSLSSGELTADSVRFADRLRLLTFVLVTLTGLMLLVLVVFDSTAFRGISRMGAVLGSIGVALVVLRSVGADVVASYGRTPEAAAALDGAWTVVLGDLATWGWVLAALGAFLAGLGWAVLHRGRAQAALRSGVDRYVIEPQTGWAELVRGLVLLAAALWAFADPTSLVRVIVRIGGFALAIAVVAQGADRLGLAERLARLDMQDDDVVSLRTIAARAAVPVVSIVVLGFVGVVLLGADDDASAFGDPAACNGHVDLCDRRLDEVTLATSHNAMSSTATGFLLPNHLTTIRAQLDQGVRGFMIDTVYGRRAIGSDNVLTSFGLVDVDSLDDTARAAAEAVRERQGDDLEDQAVYLCHGFCEIGALDAVDALTEVREWLDANPREVLVFVVQDATSPEDTADVFERAGFADLVHVQSLDAPFPTLGEMIDSGQRVFVMVEVDGGDVEWLHPAFEFSQETPFSFASVDEFSCEPNRGRDDSPLFVVNHFITLARPSNQTINDFEPLLARAEQCREERGLRPNLLSVDFVSRGDVMAVVDQLNGVD